MYWFLYDSTGAIKERSKTNALEWTNLNGYAGALGPIGTPTITWAANTRVSKGQTIVSGNLQYMCTTPGTTGNTEPTWPTTPGQTVTDGQAPTTKTVTVTNPDGTTSEETETVPAPPAVVWTCQVYNDPAVAQDAFDNPTYYTVQNGALVKTVTDAQLLAAAQAKQIAAINTGLEVTLSSGFKANYNGHTYVSTTNGQLNTEGDLKRFELDSTLTSVKFYTVDAGWIDHSQADLQAIFLEGGKWKDAQFAQAQTLAAEVTQQTSVPANPVTWTPATSW